ncbi:MAG TPA: tyrosinase family oxidase copper chaperone [Pilimelia sp.]|nr:tyrosinase family oxidase copper chaperone [Pilimelia sp.]
MSSLPRRDVLRYSAATAVVAATATGVSTAGATDVAAQKSAPPDSRDFDENYKGKKIKGVHDKGTKKHTVTVNGKKLAVMEIELPVAENSTATVTAVLGALTHWEPFVLDEGNHKDGLKRLAQKTVDTLGDAELSDFADHDH